MHLTQTLLRATVAAGATALLTIGAAVPAGAAMASGNGSDNAAAQSGNADSSNAQSGQAQGPNENANENATGQSSSAGAQGEAQSNGGSSAEAPVAGAKSQGQGPKSQPAPEQKPATPAKGSGSAKGPKADKPANANANGNASDKAANGNGHTPVTVCHRLGNGGYIELTMDENALEAHLAHGDLETVPAGGCGEVEDTDTGTDRENGTTRVTVCHRLGNGSYNLLTFDDDALEAHLAHGDVAAPTSGDAADCGSVVAPGGTTGETPGGTVGGTTDSDVVKNREAVAKVIKKFEVLGTQAQTGAPTAEAATANRAPAAVAPVGTGLAPAGILPATGAGDYALMVLAGLGLLAAGGMVLARRRFGTR